MCYVHHLRAVRRPICQTKPQETCNIDLNAFTVNEIKEILKGEGLSEKGKKVDLVQRLQDYAVARGDATYRFIIGKYPHVVKPTPPIMSDSENVEDVSDNEGQVATTLATVNIESRIREMEKHVLEQKQENAQTRVMMENMVSMMSNIQMTLQSQNQPPRVNNTAGSESSRHIPPAKMDQTDSDQQGETSVPSKKGKVTKKKGKGKNTQEIEVIDCGDGESKNPGIKGTASELPRRYTDSTVDIAKNGDQGNNNKESILCRNGKRSVTNRMIL